MSNTTTPNRVFRVVSRGDAARGAVLLPLGNASEANQARRLLVSEALALEAQHGKNAYSDYLFRHHKRPSAKEAAAIGRLLGGRVEAEDGSLQPTLNQADRMALAGIKERRDSASRRYDHILRLQTALEALAANNDDPADVIAGGSVMLDEQKIGLHLEHALCWLTRFAQEWHSREKETRA
ncbi:hypothetical protein ACQR16_16425 [Bradyrhizobium oligotrophicum]|uniref:hypothetical protein n=1 Tax=Bradyrhizobium oligotrophicum TaxID=44255 RepID=UPI003EBF0A62